jgi:hypothetical protein
MWILPLVGYAGVILGFCFLVLAIGKTMRLLLNFTTKLVLLNVLD